MGGMAEAGQLGPEWIDGVRTAWKRLLRSVTPVRGGDFGAVARDFKRGLDFIRSLHDDLVYNHGFWTDMASPIQEKKRVIDLLQKAREAFVDVVDKVQHIQSALDPTSHTYTMDNGYLYNAYLVEKRFNLDASLVQYRQEAFKAVDAIISGMLLRHLSRVVNKNGPTEFGEVPRTFSLGRVKVVFEDQPEWAWRFEKGVHRRPFDHMKYLKELDEAKQRLEKHGLGYLWYGEMHVRCESCGGENPHGKSFGVGAHYQIAQDVVRIFDDPTPNLDRLIIHEIGHRYYYKFMNQRDRASFDSYFVGSTMTPQKVLDLLVTALLALDEEERAVIPAWDAFNHEMAASIASVTSGRPSGPPNAKVLQAYVRAFWPHLQPDVKKLLDEWREGVPATSEYGQTVSAEDFAEVFADFVTGAHLSQDQVERFKAFLGRTRRTANLRSATLRLAWVREDLRAPLLRAVEAADRVALRIREMANLIKMPGSFGNISAFRGGFARSENKARHAQLISELQRRGYRTYYDTKAFWAGSAEKGLMVPNVGWSDLLDLGRKFEQDAVIWKDPSGTLGLYSFVENTVTLAVAQDGEIAAKIEVSRDLYSKARGVSFEFGFLFGQALPWDGRHPVTRQNAIKLIESGALVPPS